MNNKIGAQLFGYGSECETPEMMDNCFKQLSEIGYKAVQVSGIKVSDGNVIKKTADKYGLEIYVTHVGFDKMMNEFDEVVKYQKQLDCNYVGIGCYPGDLPTDDPKAIKKFTEDLQTLSDKFKKEGITLAFHNHAIEFEKVDGKFLIEHILDNTDVKLILDTYWVAYAGIDPVKFIEKHSDKIAFVHFKDLKTANYKKRNTVTFAEIGQGNLDWDAIIKASQSSSAVAAIVEQDSSDKETPYVSSKISYDFLKEKGFI